MENNKQAIKTLTNIIFDRFESDPKRYWWIGRLNQHEVIDLKEMLIEFAKINNESDMKNAYNYGQEDCGEFGTVLGFENWFNEYKSK